MLQNYICRNTTQECVLEQMQRYQQGFPSIKVNPPKKLENQINFLHKVHYYQWLTKKEKRGKIDHACIGRDSSPLTQDSSQPLFVFHVSDFLKTPHQLFYKMLLILIYQIASHDSIQIKHFWQEHYISNIVSSGHHIWGHIMTKLVISVRVLDQDISGRFLQDKGIFPSV